VERVEDLERQLGRNSGNSFMPPSLNVFAKPARRKPPSSGRKRGKQPGSPGSGLALVADPDQVVDRFPVACNGCGHRFVGLDERVSRGFSRRQGHDIPPTSAVVTETRWHRVRCRCGTMTAKSVPDGVPDAPCNGPRLRALAVYLVVHQHIPVERAAQLIRDLTGAEPSTGWIVAATAAAAGAVEPALDLIRALLVCGDVVHADKTTTNIGGQRAWLHVACTGELTLLGLGTRSGPEPRQPGCCRSDFDGQHSAERLPVGGDVGHEDAAVVQLLGFRHSLGVTDQ
jgi:transposase